MLRLAQEYQNLHENKDHVEATLFSESHCLTNKDGDTSLHLAAKESIIVFKAIADSMTSIQLNDALTRQNNTGNTALHYMIQNPDTHLLRYLFNKASQDAINQALLTKNHDHDTPIHLGIKNKALTESCVLCLQKGSVQTIRAIAAMEDDEGYALFKRSSLLPTKKIYNTFYLKLSTLIFKNFTQTFDQVKAIKASLTTEEKATEINPLIFRKNKPSSLATLSFLSNNSKKKGAGLKQGMSMHKTIYRRKRNRGAG